MRIRRFVVGTTVSVAPIYAGPEFPGLLMNGSCRVNVHPRAYIRICAPRIQPRMNVLPCGNYGERPDDRVREREA